MKGYRETALAELLTAARGACELVMRVYGSDDFQTVLKGPNDPVTRADKEANAFLLNSLAKVFPGVPIVAEESAPSTFEGYSNASAVLFVDPLDGTRDFIAKNGEFCVMLGLAEEGRATIGVIVCPAFRGCLQTFGAAEGVGAFRYDDGGHRTTLRIANTQNLAHARCAVSRFRRSSSVEAKLAALECQELVAVGSSGIKGAQVGSGELDLQAHPSGKPVWLWDACAPEAFVRAAGGLYTDVTGKSFDYRGPISQGEGTLAANPQLHEEARRCFERYELTFRDEVRNELHDKATNRGRR